MIACISKFINGMTRFISIGDAIEDLRQIYRNKELSTKEKIIRCFSNSAFIVAEGGAFRARATHSTTQLEWETAAGLTDVGRRGVRLAYKSDCSRDDVIDLVGFTALRASDLMDRAVFLEPTTFQDAKPLAEGLGAAGNMILARDSLKDASSKGWKAIQALAAHFQGKKISTPPIEVKLPRGEAPELRINSEFMDAFLEVRNASTIQDFTKIPEILCSDPFFLQLKCPITKKPIRYPLVVATSTSFICYEKEAILHSLASNQTPPAWPQEILFTRENLKESPTLQAKIDTRLQDYLEDFRELSFSEINATQEKEKPFFYDLAKTLEIHNPAIPDSKIKEKISRIIPRNTYSSISVSTVDSYQFPNENFPQKVRHILLKPRPCDSFSHVFTDSPPIDLPRAISAILGSEDREDETHLLSAYRRNSTIHIYISTDLEDIHFKLQETQQVCVII